VNDDVMIAVDPHKASNTAAVLDPVTKTLIETARFANSAGGYEQLTAFAARWAQRRWAVEGCHGAGRSLAQRLAADGELVLDVAAAGSPHLPGRAWSAPRLKVSAPEPVHAGVDGEAVELSPPLWFAIRPAALRIRISSRHRAPRHQRACPSQATHADLRAGGDRRTQPAGTRAREGAEPGHRG
jgi:hypothetical protein